MNRKKKAKSVLRQEGNVYVLDLFVKVPLGAHGSSRNQLSCRRKRAKEASYIRLQQSNLLMAEGVSVEDRSRRSETVRPQLRGHFESQSECDSALSAKSDRNDIELNGKTDDEDMEGGEMDGVR